jgi:hypothetical protein
MTWQQIIVNAPLDGKSGGGVCIKLHNHGQNLLLLMRSLSCRLNNIVFKRFL